MSRVRNGRSDVSGPGPLPARLDPRVGRPPRPRSSRSGAGAERAPVRSQAPSAPPPRRTAHPSDDVLDTPPRFARVLGLTVVGAVLPGAAFVAAGRRTLGAILLTASALLVGAAVWLVLFGQEFAVRAAVSRTALLVLIGAAVGLAVVWALVVIAGYRMLAPDSTSRGQHVVGGALVVLLSLGVAAPPLEAAHLASVQLDLIGGLFTEGESATVPETAAVDPWGSRDRINVLLLGGDGGDDRSGVRTDTVIVASIDTESGATTTISLPRNLQELPFPEGSPLDEVYPDGFWAGSESESLLNAVYRNGPQAHPDILGPTDNAGADFLKLGVGAALGITIDYYVLVNLDGFSQLTDALGGITVNVNYWVPIGGEPTLGHLPLDYISPGPDQHMDGERALHYARGRFGLTDYQRMDRQRCMISAMVSAADPLTLLTRYQEVAASAQDMVSTDIPVSVLGDFAALALKIKDSGIRSVVLDDTVITPAYPDYDEIRELVRQALDAPPAAGGPVVDDSTSGGAGAPTAAGGAADDGGAPAGGGASAPAGAPPAPVTEVQDACAYDPVQAQEALDQGEPPTA